MVTDEMPRREYPNFEPLDSMETSADSSTLPAPDGWPNDNCSDCTNCRTFYYAVNLQQQIHGKGNQ
jgi:hypothetical protein